MSILKNRKKLVCLFSSIIGFTGGFMVFGNKVNAQVSIGDYNLLGVDGVYKDNETPSAYQIFGSPYFKDGTIMYKQSYRGVTYYSPKPPSQSKEALGSSKDYLNWHFKDFQPNQIVFDGLFNGDDVLFESSIYFAQARINSNVTVQGTKVDDTQDIKYNLGTIKAGTVVNVLSVTDFGTVRVYFDLNGLTDINGKPLLKDGYTPVGRVPRSSVTPIGETIKIYYPESANRSNSARKVYDNFKPYAKKANYLNDSSHKDLEPSPYFNPTFQNDPYNLSGKRGEWRYLGLSAKGELVVNPYFPSDSLHFRGNSPASYYDWRYTPWDDSDPEGDERSKYSSSQRPNILRQDKELFIEEYGEPSIYNKDQYLEEKRNLIRDMVNRGELFATNGDINRLTDRFMLLTNPRRDTPILVGQRKSSTASRRIVFLKPTRDLYVKKMIVRDMKGNTIATANGDINGNFTINGDTIALKRGRQYTCSIILSNGSNSEMIKDTLQANFGYRYGSDSFDKKRPYYNLPYRDSLDIGNKGGLISAMHSDSQEFTFAFAVPTNFNESFIDLYGYVGGVHTGIDNLDYSNDIGAVRLKVSPELMLQAGDIEVSRIELIDSNGNVVYRKNADGSETIKKAPKPGQIYSIKYTATYTGEDRLYYEWVSSIPDNPHTTANEYRPGYFLPPVLLKYEVPIKYEYTRKVQDTLSDDTISKSGKFVDSNGSTQIPMSRNKEMSFTINNVMLEHPFISTYFEVASNSTEINGDLSNDRLDTVVRDVYDISISNVKILPQTEYIGNEDKNITYNVIYDATLNVPDYVTANDYRTQIETSINVNGKVVTVIDQLEIGTNTGISHEVKDVPVRASDSSSTASVVLNYTKASYESGNYANNEGVSNASISKIKNPIDGNPNDTASNTNNSNNNTNPNRGGDANNNCLVPRTSNTWSNTYKTKNWSATPLTYRVNSTNSNHTFYKYNVVSTDSKTVESKENFEIKKVLFKSKSTVDKKLGDKKDGWVELSKASEKDLGFIKAGYGFELKIVTEYKTNALLNNPSWSVNKVNGGKTVSNLNVGLNFNPDIFVELPGDKNNRKILSVSGYASTLKGLQVKQTKNGAVEGGMNVYEWEYTIKPSRTVGLVETGKVFIPQNLKDGDYKLSIYTPPTSGASSLNEYNTSRYNLLCDRKDVTVKVKGSATDDLNSHVTQ